MFDAMSEREVKINNVIEAGDTIVVEFVFRSKNTGPLVTPQGEIPPTGKTASMTSIAIYELRDGKLAGSRGMYDRLVAVKGDRAMSLVQDRTCTACYTEITAQNQNDLLQERLVLCKNCGRILYLAESE